MRNHLRSLPNDQSRSSKIKSALLLKFNEKFGSRDNAFEQEAIESHVDQFVSSQKIDFNSIRSLESTITEALGKIKTSMRAKPLSPITVTALPHNEIFNSSSTPKIDEWSKIAEYNKRKDEEERKNRVERERRQREDMILHLNKQLNEKRQIQDKLSEYEKGYHKSVMKSVEKMREEDKHSEQIKEQKRITEKMIRETQLKDITIGKIEEQSKRSKEDASIAVVLNRQKESEDKALSEKKAKDKTALSQIVRHYEEQISYRKMQQLREKEINARAITEYTSLLDQREKERNAENEERLKYVKASMSPSYSSNASPRNLINTLSSWTSTEDRKSKILERLKNKALEKQREETIKYIATQVESRKSSKQELKKLERHYGEINKKDAEKDINDDVQKRNLQRLKNKMNADFLKAQIESKKPSYYGMSETEKLINKKLIDEIGA